MIKIEYTDVYGFEAAIRGMRNPMNSWDKRDSVNYCGTGDSCAGCPLERKACALDVYPINGWCFKLGENDLALMRKLAHAGDDHGKFARFITVTVDITAPLYWWKELDTYKVGTVSNSCSTMHKLMDKPFEVSDFSFEKVLAFDNDKYIEEQLDIFNDLRDSYLHFDEYYANGVLHKNLKSKKDVWYVLIQLLPSSYNQRRTVQLNYQVLNRIYHARKNHKLDEWHVFCDWVEDLPWFKEIYLFED